MSKFKIKNIQNILKGEINMKKNKKVCAIAASTIIVASILFTSTVLADGNMHGILSKLERQLSVNRIL